LNNQIIAILIATHVLMLSVGFTLGFYWLKTQLEKKMVGIMDFNSGSGGFDLQELGLGGEEDE